jgi:beta-phosphoglucomutase-like phosphatase (HAD superfamily)
LLEASLGCEFKAIFFDLDGTVVDFPGPLYIVARNALDQLAAATVPAPTLLEAIAGGASPPVARQSRTPV